MRKEKAECKMEKEEAKKSNSCFQAGIIFLASIRL
jgi:hypothetical protein